MKLRNIKQQYESNGSQVVDAASRVVEPNRFARRHASGGKRNQPLYRGTPILTQIWVERGGLG